MHSIRITKIYISSFIRREKKNCGTGDWKWEFSNSQLIPGPPTIFVQNKR